MIETLNEIRCLLKFVVEEVFLLYLTSYVLSKLKAQKTVLVYNLEGIEQADNFQYVSDEFYSVSKELHYMATVFV